MNVEAMEANTVEATTAETTAVCVACLGSESICSRCRFFFDQPITPSSVYSSRFFYSLLYFYRYS